MNNEILDVEEFLERVQDDRELMLELLDIYEQDYVQRRKALGQAFDKKNAQEVSNTAHAMKGASGNISAKKIHVICYKLEQLGKDGNLGEVAGLLAQLDEEFKALQKSMTEIRAQYKK